MLSPAVASHDLTSLSFDNPVWSVVQLNGPFATNEEFIKYMALNEDKINDYYVTLCKKHNINSPLIDDYLAGIEENAKISRIE